MILAGLLTCRSTRNHAFPSFNDSGIVWFQSLLTALAQRYGFAPYSLFSANPETGDTEIISAKRERITETEQECKSKKTVASGQAGHTFQKHQLDQEVTH